MLALETFDPILLTLIEYAPNVSNLTENSPELFYIFAKIIWWITQ